MFCWRRKKRWSEIGASLSRNEPARWRPINHRSFGREKNAHDRLFDRVPIAAARRTISRSGDRGFEIPPLLFNSALVIVSFMGRVYRPRTRFAKWANVVRGRDSRFRKFSAPAARNGETKNFGRIVRGSARVFTPGDTPVVRREHGRGSITFSSTCRSFSPRCLFSPVFTTIRCLPVRSAVG